MTEREIEKAELYEARNIIKGVVLFLLITLFVIISSAFLVSV